MAAVDSTCFAAPFLRGTETITEELQLVWGPSPSESWLLLLDLTKFGLVHSNRDQKL